MAAVFIAQSTLQEWADAGKVQLEDTLLTLIKERREVNLTPAVRFTEVIGGDEDPHGLMGKVKTKTQLDEIEAEHYMDSVICGDVGYQVVEGFLGDLMASKPVGHAKSAVKPAASVAPAPVEPMVEAKAASEPAASGPATSSPATSDEDDDAAALGKLFLETVG